MADSNKNINFVIEEDDKIEFFKKCEREAKNPSALLRNCIYAFNENRLTIEPKEDENNES